MLAKGVKYSDTTQDRVGMLIHDFVFMANVMQPKVCIIENVPSIRSADVFADSLERLRRNGYLVAHKVLVASDYGAPQKRKRLIVIATRQDIARAAKIENEEALQDAFPKPTVTQPITVREALDGIVNDAAEREMLLSKARRGSEYEFMRLLPHAPSKPIRLSDVAPSLGSNFLLTRASWDHPSSTITATGAGGRGGVLHPIEDRPFTVAELKRITGLPDDFKLTGTFLQKAERVGRMVPPPL
jgi:DNA (cytosine-5)-methyltransferase 1